MAKDKPPTYTPAPELPRDPELRRRFDQIVAVLMQTQTMSGAARSLDLSRNHFQSIFHRVLTAMIDAITPKPAGRPAKPEREAELEAENARLTAENESLRTRVEAIERMLGVVGGIASGKTPLPRSRGKKTKPEDPEPATLRRTAVIAMREERADTKLCAAALGVSPSTIRRCSKLQQSAARSPRSLDASACQRARAIVRATHGLVGAANLGRMVALPRRTCAELKRREVREMEIERKARCAMVTVAAPGLIRGFDAMHVESTDHKAYLLVAADAAIPYRTSIVTVSTYDAANVLAVLEADFEQHGAPLVVRMDRIACQRTPEVERFLARYRVLALHGPPRHPYFYGQLERQNREHRAWLAMLGPVTHRELVTAAESMRTSLNGLWPRSTLDGCTAEQAWNARTPINVDRDTLIDEVHRRTAELVTAGIEALRARRIAIETALTQRELVHIKQGGWC